MADINELSVLIARLEGKADGNHRHILDTLGRIENRVNEVAQTLKDHEDTLQKHNDRLTRLEKDLEWMRKLAVPVVGVAVATVGRWVKTFLGI